MNRSIHAATRCGCYCWHFLCDDAIAWHLVIDRSARTPQWLFDALYTVGETAVPINMMILGCNLSAGIVIMNKTRRTLLLLLLVPTTKYSRQLITTATTCYPTMIWMVIGKMIVPPDWYRLGSDTRTYFGAFPTTLTARFTWRS
jgi:hypothetical protein